MLPLDRKQTRALTDLAEIDKTILRLVAQGRSSKEIGKSLDRSPLTIDGRLKDVCTRIGAANRVQAASMLLLSEAPPNSGGSQIRGIVDPSALSPSSREERGDLSSQSAAGQGPWSLLNDLRRLFIPRAAASESSGQKLFRVVRSVALIVIVLAAAVFFLTSAVEAFQEMVFGIPG